MEISNKKKKNRSKKEKKLIKLIDNSENDEEIEHELSYYVNDRVKLMKEVLKVVKPSKIMSMAPACLRNHDIEEINSILLEELLGISNKRLKYIFNGQNLDEDSSSSTDPEDDNQQPIDIISLDDISDDDFDVEIVEVGTAKSNKHNCIIKEEIPKKKIKKEKTRKNSESKPKSEEANLMSVLELLELQARARAIRSQLALESSIKVKEAVEKENVDASRIESDNEDAVIIQSPKLDEIVISSESENEPDCSEKKNPQLENSTDEISKKIGNEIENTSSNENVSNTGSVTDLANQDKPTKSEVQLNDGDGIIINFDQSEIDLISD